MIQLLFPIVLSEMALILILLSESRIINPIKRILIIELIRMKQGRAHLVVRTVTATGIIILGSSLYGLMDVQKRIKDTSLMNPTEHVLMANSSLETTLLGFSLFLAFTIGKLHDLIEVKKQKDQVISREEKQGLHNSKIVVEKEKNEDW